MTETGFKTADRRITRSGGVPRRPRLADLLERYLLLGLVALVVVVFSVLPATSGTFPTTANLAAVLANQSIVALVAVAVILPLAAGHFDFSVAANASLSSVVVAAAITDLSWPLWLAVPAGIVTGMLVGAVNGFLVAWLRTSAFVTTLATATLLGGVVQWATGGQQITPAGPTGLSELSAQRFAGLNLVTYLVAAVLLAFWWLLRHTPYGRRLYAVGSNSRAAVLIGIRADRLVFSTFAVSGLIAGLTGCLYVARMGGSAADGGTGMMFPALAAVFLGASAVQPGRYNIAGTVLGLLFVAACVSGLTLSGVAAWVEPVFNGVALAVAVCVAALLARRRTGPTAV